MPRFLPAAFWAAILFTLTMALLPQPPQPPVDISDKVQHILAFAALTALALAAFPRAGPVTILAPLVILGAAIELLQAGMGLGRDGAWLDWAADCGAIAAVLLVGVPLRRAAAARFSRSP